MWTLGCLFSLLTFQMADEPAESADEKFDYYLGEFLNYEMDIKHPMAVLIANQLAESLFDTTKEDVVKRRIQKLKKGVKEKPDRIERILDLDKRLTTAFNLRVKKAKHKRLIYSAGGTLIGAVVGLPIGKFLASRMSMGNQVLWISIPASALTGAGVGFLLGDLLLIPKYHYDEGSLTKDLQFLYSELEDTL